jgi:transcription termination/antitermination protein NusA
LLAEKFFQAIDEICKLKEIKKEYMFKAIEAGLITSYKRSFEGNDSNTEVIIDEVNKIIALVEKKKVVERVRDSKNEINLKEAAKIDPKAVLHDLIKVEVTSKEFGRVAAEVCKQVVTQKLRDAEIETIYEEFILKEHEAVLGEISKISPTRIYVNLRKIEGVFPIDEQIRNEKYTIGAKMYFYIFSVQKRQKEPMILLSRTHPGLLKRLMELEIPELKQGLIEIKGIVREPGIRAKVSVISNDEKIDPVGTCIGAKGTRINSVGGHLNNEKIDVIRWSSNPIFFIANSLSPAKISADNVTLDEEKRIAQVEIKQEQFSLAIGKQGFNVKLAARLTGFKVDISTKEEK